MMDNKEFNQRRKRLMNMVGDDCIAILPTAPECTRNNDVLFPFRPNSDFYYLTGYPEPKAVAVIMPNRNCGEYILFCRQNDPNDEVWNGKRSGLEGACDIYAADDAFPIEDIGDILPSLMEKKEQIFYTMGTDVTFDQRMLRWANEKYANKEPSVTDIRGLFVSLKHILHDMRLYKSRHEISLMRKAAKISSEAHKSAMQICQPGLMEYQIEAELIHKFMHHGSRYPAYPCIVGGGANGCILHYTDNNAVLQDGDMLLIDAGAEHEYYASDITRTFPVNGKFTKAQKDIYQLVLDAQSAAIKQVKPGNHWNDPHQAALETITHGMVELGILKGKVDTLIKEHAYSRYYIHRTGHWLGLDVHDVGDYKIDGNWRVLEPGMVMTIEPGLYLSSANKGLAKKWWDIGIRIEDDVLVTKDGADVLSKDIIKTIDEIESLMTKTA